MGNLIVTVFGGSGFFGRYLVRRLVSQGATVRVAVRDPEEAAYLKIMGDVGSVVPMAADITDADSTRTATNGAGAVVNLVGRLAGSATQFQKLHVDGARNLATIAAEEGVRHFAHVSALGADPGSPSDYARTKAEGEAAVLDAFPGAVIFRPGVVFGPEDKFFKQFAGLARFTWFLPVLGGPAIPKVRFFKDGELWSIDFFRDGGSRFQPVYVGDVADCILSGLEGGQAVEGKIFELGGPCVYSAKEIMELLLANTGRRRILFPAPYWCLTTLSWFIEKTPWPLLTTDQVKLLRVGSVVAEGAATMADLGVIATPTDAILPGYLERFRLPRERHPEPA
ncbi:MAG: complex I NDUFA9 subunit family protein [Pseudomonadota bacterium]|nr:complex I NDUFA9 subunit family protein [Pseudomonadota bacterium]